MFKQIKNYFSDRRVNKEVAQINERLDPLYDDLIKIQREAFSKRPEYKFTFSTPGAIPDVVIVKIPFTGIIKNDEEEFRYDMCQNIKKNHDVIGSPLDNRLLHKMNDILYSKINSLISQDLLKYNPITMYWEYYGE